MENDTHKKTGTINKTYVAAKTFLDAATLKTEANEIKDALFKFAGIDKDTVEVIVQEDTVSLDGRVNTTEQREDARKIVESVIKRQVKVENNLEVNTEDNGALDV